MHPTKEEYFAALIARHGKERQDKFSKASVAICGLGGLGSIIAIALARAGIGELHLIDFDKVDVTNLHRQQYFENQVGVPKPQALSENLRKINPYIRIRTDFVRMTTDNLEPLLSDADIVCEAFDDAECKAMLVNGVLEKFPEKYIVSASGMAGFGDGNEIRTRRVTEHFYLCGDEHTDVSDGVGLVSARVMLCASHQALKVLQILERS